MRRSICYCEPAAALAGEVNTWKFIFTPAANLPKGTKLKFDMDTKGRNIDWEIPDTDLKSDRNVIYAKLDSGKVIQAKKIQMPDLMAPQFEFTLPQELQAGKNFVIFVGAPGDSTQKKFQGPWEYGPNSCTKKALFSSNNRPFR